MASLATRVAAHRLAALALGLAAATHSLPLEAQDYPSKTVTIVVPLAAGTGMDSITRIYGEELAKVLGKPVVIENQPGAALLLGTQNVARATPDGHTLLATTTLPMTAAHRLNKKVNYDPDRDLVPISIYLTSPFLLVVNPGLGINTMKDFVAYARKNSDTPITFAHSGAGGLTHLSMEIIKKEFNFAATHVPYRNSGQIVADVVGGHVPSAISETGIALPLIQDGKLKALGITSAKRHPQLPEVPSIGEALDKPEFEVVAWHVLAAPSATPKPILDRLITEMQRITADEGFQKRVLAAGLIPRSPISAEQMRTFIQSERTRWSGVIQALGLEGSQQ